jgi:diguanylate cyclase (GGDEF)-like protein
MGINQKLIYGLFAIGGLTAGIIILQPERSTNWTIAAAGILGCVALIVLIQHVITAQFRSLILAAEEFSRGNFAHRIQSTRIDEFGELARTFDRLGETLAEYASQIVRESEGRASAERARGDAEELLLLGLELVPAAILIVNADGEKVEFSNEAAYQLFGNRRHSSSLLPAAKSIEHWPLSSSDGALLDAENNPILRAIHQNEHMVDVQATVVVSNGSRKTVNVTAIPFAHRESGSNAAIIVLNDVTEQCRMLEQIEHVAYHDGLTGLANRSSIINCIQQAIDRDAPSHFALLYMDFDRFKLINDSLGHEIGDLLLMQIAERIRNFLRTENAAAIPARIGGDEFVVFFDHLSTPCHAMAAAQSLLAILSEAYILRGQTVASSASIGVVTSEHSFATAAEMLRDADLAMYKAKHDGKARVTLFDQVLREQVQGRLQVESDLRKALKGDEFRVDVQPIVDLRSGIAVAFEAFLRWQHPTNGRMSAVHFLDVAEETGLIVPIGDQIIRRACLQIAKLRSEVRQAPSRCAVHVNLSRLQLLLPTLPDVLIDAVTEAGIYSSDLVLELGEISVASELSKVAHRIQELHSLGFKFCLDNFGSGHLSLACLRQLPFDFIKLDRSLVASIDSEPESAALVEAILTIANAHNLSVIAEGVERETQASQLLSMGCQLGQGFLLHRPLPAETLDKAVWSLWNQSTIHPEEPPKIDNQNLRIAR